MNSMSVYHLLKVSHRRGFTMIEILIASLLVVIVSAGVYKFLQTQSLSQVQSLGQMKSRTLAAKSLELFQDDLSKVDANWHKLGVASIFPHPGFSHHQNYYLQGIVAQDPFDLNQGQLSDAVTLVRKHPIKHTIHEIQEALQDPDPDSPDFEPVFGSVLNLTEPMRGENDLEVGDWVMVFEPGKYVLAVIDRVIHTEDTSTQVYLRLPDAAHMQQIHLNQAGHASGFVTHAGVVLGNYDYTGNMSFDPQDQWIQFSNRANMQVVSPVTWSLDYRTSDGLPKSASNTYVLDAFGQKQSVIVRSELRTQGIAREYLAPVGQLGFTYDLLVGQVSGGGVSIDGYTDGEIIRDIGRDQDTSMNGFFQLASNPEQHATNFIATPNIVGVRMMVSTQSQKHKQQYGLRNEIKVAIDPSFQDERYQQDAFVQARGSDNIHALAGLSGTQHVAKPLYFRPPSEDTDYIVMPVMDLDGQSTDVGQLLILDRDGNPMGDPIVLDAGADRFYPTQVTPIEQNNKTYLMVSGLGLVGQGEDAQRVPMIATIDISVGGGSMVDILATEGTGQCSIAGCKLHILDSQSQDTTMKDTSAGMFMHEGELWMTSLTKNSVNDERVTFFKTSFADNEGDVTFSDFETVTLDTQNTLKDRVVTAVSDKPMLIDGQAHIPVCLSRSVPCHRPIELIEQELEEIPLLSFLKLLKQNTWIGQTMKQVFVPACLASDGVSDEPCSTEPLQDGKVYLYPLDASSAPKLIANHNYSCTSLQSVGENLLVGGKLVTNVIKEHEIQAMVSGENEDVIELYTDEIQNSSLGHYADAYFPTMSSYAQDSVQYQEDQMYAKPITWNAGTSVQTFNDGTIGVSLANIKIPHPEEGTFDLSEQNFITMDMSPAGMKDRVISSIQTWLANINDSQVSSVYHAEQRVLSGEVVLPGVFWVNTARPRKDPRALPFLFEDMQELSWVEFFMDFHDPDDRYTDTPLVLPVPPSDQMNQQCEYSVPASCGFN